MPSSHISLNVHVVFSTKERAPSIKDDWRERLHGYLGGIARDLDAVPLAVGGVADHVHLLVGLKAVHRFDYFMRDLKAGSSEWIHKELREKFEWQKGYGAFSVSPSSVGNVKNYILNQPAHHRRKSFQEEYLEILQASGVEFDERYLW